MLPRRIPLDDLGRGDRVMLVASDGRIVARSLRLALSVRHRLLGLLLGPPLGPEEALLLRPCAGVHTWFMRHALDVVFVDAKCRVLVVRRRLQPWRSTGFVRTARAAIELPAGRLDAVGLNEGDSVAFQQIEC